MKKQNHCVYVLQSRNDDKAVQRLHIKPERLRKEHVLRSFEEILFERPFVLPFCQYHLSKQDASGREYEFKVLAGKRAFGLDVQK